MPAYKNVVCTGAPCFCSDQHDDVNDDTGATGIEVFGHLHQIYRLRVLITSHNTGIRLNIQATGVTIQDAALKDARIDMFASMKDFIRAEQLTRNYHTTGKDSCGITDINLTISKGEFTVIMGTSGSGKSTLLYLLSGLDKPQAGKIWVNQVPLHGRKEKDLSLLRRRTIGFVYQDNNLVSHLNLLDNMLIAGYLVAGNRREIKNRALDLLQILGIGHLSHRFPTQVSGGELQRAAIARAMINQPMVLMADEPTGNLNSHAAQNVLDCFSTLHANGQTILMVTHDLKSACRGQRIIFLKDGRLSDSDDNTFLENSLDRETRLFNWLKQRGW